MSIPHWFNIISLKWHGNNVDSTSLCPVGSDAEVMRANRVHCISPLHPNTLPQQTSSTISTELHHTRDLTQGVDNELIRSIHITEWWCLRCTLHPREVNINIQQKQEDIYCHFTVFRDKHLDRKRTYLKSKSTTCVQSCVFFGYIVQYEPLTIISLEYKGELRHLTLWTLAFSTGSL